MRAQTLGRDAFALELASERRPFVLDVRPREDYEAGHVPGSRNVPVHELAHRTKDLPPVKVARILVIGEPGKRTEAAANWLVLLGWPDVAVVEGGVGAWAGELERGPEPPPPSRGPELRVIR